MTMVNFAPVTVGLLSVMVRLSVPPADVSEYGINVLQSAPSVSSRVKVALGLVALPASVTTSPQASTPSTSVSWNSDSLVLSALPSSAGAVPSKPDSRENAPSTARRRSSSNRPTGPV